MKKDLFMSAVRHPEMQIATSAGRRGVLRAQQPNGRLWKDSLSHMRCRLCDDDGGHDEVFRLLLKVKKSREKSMWGRMAS